MSKGKIPRLGVHHRTLGDAFAELLVTRARIAVANAERQKRIDRGDVMRCRVHDLPWTECTSCSVTKGRRP